MWRLEGLIDHKNYGAGDLTLTEKARVQYIYMRLTWRKCWGHNGVLKTGPVCGVALQILQWIQTVYAFDMPHRQRYWETYLYIMRKNWKQAQFVVERCRSFSEAWYATRVKSIGKITYTSWDRSLKTNLKGNGGDIEVAKFITVPDPHGRLSGRNKHICFVC